MAIFYAVCCLVCSALNDFIFKLFASGARSRGIFILQIGVIWFAMLCFLPLSWENWPQTLFWGCVSGFFSITANLMLIAAMKLQSAGICSTIYRLNLVPTVLGAWLLLGETIGAVHWLGIAAAVAAVLAFMPAPEERHPRLARFAARGIRLVTGAAFLRAAMGIAYKYAFLGGADRTGITLINALFWIGGGAWYAFSREQRQLSVSRSQLAIGTLSGLCVGGIIYFMAAAVQYGNAAVVLPIAQMSFPATLLLSVCFLHEKLTARKLTGLGFAILAVLLLCLPG